MEMTLHRRVVIILEIDIIQSGEDVGRKIGDPTPYTEGKAQQIKISATFRVTDVLSECIWDDAAISNVHQSNTLVCSVCSWQMFLVGQAKGPQSAPKAAESRPPLQPQNRNEGKSSF